MSTEETTATDRYANDVAQTHMNAEHAALAWLHGVVTAGGDFSARMEAAKVILAHRSGNVTVQSEPK